MPRADLIPVRGAIAEPLTMEVVGELVASDLPRLSDTPRTNVPIIKKLRAVHHRQAQLLAQGKKVNEVALLVGCTSQRIVQLQEDVAFKELVAYYQDQIAVATIDQAQRIQETIVDIGELALNELHERLEDPDKIKTIGADQLRKTAEFAMDRTVAPPKTAPQSSTAPATVTINFGTKVGGPIVDEKGKIVDVEEGES